MTVEVNIATKVDATAGDDLTKEGKLADATVLELDVAEALETFLINVVKHAKRVPETNLFGREMWNWYMRGMRVRMSILSVVLHLNVVSQPDRNLAHCTWYMLKYM